MKVSITISDLDKTGAEALLEFAASLSNETGPEETPAPKKRGRPAKEEVEEETEEETEVEESDDDSEDEEEAPVKKGKKKAPTEEDVIDALKLYSEKHDRKAAIKMLKKFKVAKVQDLEESDYPKLIKLLEEN